MFLKPKDNVGKNISQSSLFRKVIKVVSSLVTSIENENTLLKNGAMSQIESVVNKKIASLQEFEKIQKEVDAFVRSNKVNPDDPSCDLLKKAFAKLSEVADKNEILLMSNIEISNKIVELYKEYKREDTIKQYGYNKEGKVTASKNLERFMPSISLNDKI